MISKIHSAAIFGIDAYDIEVEVNITGQGKETSVNIVGLPDNAVRESKDRVYSAIETSSLPYPFGRIIINLAPADIKKEGAAFDLPIAVGIIAASGFIKPSAIERGLFLGELALNGMLRPVKGVLSIVLKAAKNEDIDFIVVPKDNAAEASVACGAKKVYSVGHLRETIDFLKGKLEIKPAKKIDPTIFNDRDFSCKNSLDFGDVKGQIFAKRALKIAAAGGHNLLMIGPPGTGKSMLAKRVPGILPPMHLNEALEVTKTHSIVGLLPMNVPVLNRRPFRAPHHTISDAGLLGGQSVPTPGEVSLAHNGVLFLDELPEFKRNVLEVLRQPLENGTVTISRASGSFTFPANFMLIAAMNPCPCGFFGSMTKECRCSTYQIQRYRNKISGPLLDRIDIHVEVAPLNENELLNLPEGESSSEIRNRVRNARKIQLKRFEDRGIYSNAEMSERDVYTFCHLDKECKNYLKHTIREFQLSARAYDRILKVARTIADLENKNQVELENIAEAVQYRSMDRKLW